MSPIGKISVVVPVYNVAEYLQQCVDSILNQTYSDLEVILIDDGSTDDSGVLCDAFARRDDRVKVTHQPNSGLARARNIGLSQASGTTLCFVDSDDWLPPNSLAVMAEGMLAFDADMAIGQTVITQEQSPVRDCCTFW